MVNRLKEIKERLIKMTPGPYEVEYEESADEPTIFPAFLKSKSEDRILMAFEDCTVDDADFYERAPQDIEYLLGVIDELAGVLKSIYVGHGDVSPKLHTTLERHEMMGLAKQVLDKYGLEEEES